MDAMEPATDPRRRAIAIASALALTAIATDAHAATWSFEVAPVYVEVTGHDQHVLTVRRAGHEEQVELETDSALGYRAAVLYERGGAWAYGLDFFIHRTDQGAGPRRESSTGPADPLAYEIPHRGFGSTGEDEILYFQTLEDTTVELWVGDLYARRRIGGGEGRTLAFLVGLRNADFDNDYRAIAGVEDVGGTRVDASSNYSRMMGPLAGLVVTLGRGRHSFTADLRQSFVLGDIELSRTLRDFVGPPGAFGGAPEDVPPGPELERIATTDEITVPMTDLRVAWRYRLGERWQVGASVEGTAWWDLAVPPGVVPDRPDALEETTLVTYGLGATLGYTF